MGNCIDNRHSNILNYTCAFPSCCFEKKKRTKQLNTYDEEEILAGYTGNYIPSKPRYAPEPEYRPAPRHSSQLSYADETEEIAPVEKEPYINYVGRGFAQFSRVDEREPEPEPAAQETQAVEETAEQAPAETQAKSGKYGEGYSADLDDVPAPTEDIATAKANEQTNIIVPIINTVDDDDEDTSDDDAQEDNFDDDLDDVSDGDDDDEDGSFAASGIAATTDLSAFASMPRVPRKPLSERLKETTDKNKLLYSMLKNELLSYKNLKARMGTKVESFNIKRIQIAKIALSGKTLRVYLALKPQDFDETVYKHKDVSDKRRFEFTPMMLKLKNERNLEKIIELVHDIMLQSNFEKRKKFERFDFVKDLRNPPATALGMAGHPDLVVDSADAVTASAISDEVAEDCVVIQECGPIGKIKSQTVTIAQISNGFDSGETVDIKRLKKARLISRDANYVEVSGEGTLTKVLTVVANAYDFNAVKAILSLGGTPVYLKEKEEAAK